MNKKVKFVSAASLAALMISAVSVQAAPPAPGTGASFGRFMNTSEANNAQIVIQYVDAAGNVSTRSATVSPFGSTSLNPALGDITPALPNGWTGAVVASSDQDIIGMTYINYTGGGPFLNGATGQTADDKASADYPATYAPADNLFFPTVARRDSEAGKLYIQNTNAPGGASAQVYVNFYDRCGVQYPAARIVRTVLGGAQTTVDMFTDTSLPAVDDDCTPGGSASAFLGSAYVTSTQPIAGVAVHLWFYGAFAYSAKPRTAGSTSVVFPKVVRRCLAGQGCVNPDSATEPNYTDQTGVVCANTSSTTAANVTLTFTNRAGTVEATQTDTIQPLSSRGYNTRYGGNLSIANRNNIRGLDQGGTSTNPAFLGSVTLASTQPVLCVAKQLYDKDAAAQVGSPTDDVTRQALGYDGIATSQASNTLYVPIAWRTSGTSPCASGQWRYTGIIVYNAGGANATVRVRFYTTNGTASPTVLDFTDPSALPPSTPRGYNTRFDSGLPTAQSAILGSSFDGVAVISANQPLIAVSENWQNCPGTMTDSNISELNR